MSISNTSLTGAAGAHYVMYKLLSKGYIAGLAPEGAPIADIIVTDRNVKQSIAIQVKTRLQKGSDKGWYMKEKHESINEKNLFYCFVDMGNKDDQDSVVYILPSSVVAETLHQTHLLWLNTPGKKGQKHNATEMRRLLPDYNKSIQTTNSKIKQYSVGWLDKYKENWSLLGLDK